MSRRPPEKYPMFNQELTDWAVSSKDELVAADTYGSISERNALDDFLGQSESAFPEVLEVFREEKDPLKKLELLIKMSLRDAVDAVELSSRNERISNYLSNRLDFYDSLVKGTATKTAKDGESWYNKTTQEYVYAKAGDQIKIDNSYITPDTVSRGLFRDVCYAQMIGTPEMGIYKMAERKLKKQEIPTTHLPPIKGYHSGIEQKTCATEGDIGVAYPFLRKLYDRAIESLRRKQEQKGKPFSEDEFEHQAVLMATDWLVEAGNYNPPNRGPESSYVSSPEEAVAWARLGDQVKAQFRGMRQKIQDVDLHNIARFIGRSGDTEFSFERKRLKKQIAEGDDSEQTKEALEIAEKKYTQHASLAHRAIDLHFRLRQFEADAYRPSIDWINNAPLGLIKWTHTALSRGVNEKTAFGYAKASYIFPGAVVDRELIEQASVLSPEDADNIREISKINVVLGIESSPKELCKLSEYSPLIYKGLLEKGYTVDALASHPWLNDQNIVDLPEGEEFPYAAKESNQISWCVKHAFHTPGGWNQKRLGAIILRRLQIDVDKNIHDATYWLQEFEVPEEKNGTLYKDHAREIELLHSLTDVPEDIRRRLPSKRNKYEILFSEDATQLIYEAALPFAQNGTVEYDQIVEAVRANLQGFEADPRSAQSLKIPLPKLKERVEACLQELRRAIDSNAPYEPVPKIVGDLKVVGNDRTNYINTAQKWVETHSTTPRTLLTTAWGNRELALADGCEDNPRAIKQWADLNALRGAFDDMENRGQLPENISKKDILTYGDWLRELVRCYDGNTAIRTLSEIKKRYNPEYQMTPRRINLGNGIVGEIFSKNDPRGCTIGYDTGCCMTLGGASESCIKAGYEKPPYGFFALYRQDELVAQSFLYNNNDTNPDTIVCDNIEANQGRDKDKLLELYNEFFRRYLEEQLRRDSNPRFSRVHIGEGYSSIGLSGLQPVDSVDMPDSEIYTDAGKQRLLLEIKKERVERLKKYKTSIITPDIWEQIKESILKIEKGAFDGKGYTEEQLAKEFSNPDNIVVVIKDGDDVIGYNTSLPQSEDTLWVSSTALLPKYQGQGLVSDIMYSLDIEARNRGYEYYERTAAVENGYAEKLKRNYEVVEERNPSESPYGLQQYLKMKIPDHIPSSRLDAQKEVEKPKEKVTFPSVTPKQAAIVADLEKEIYPPDLAQDENDWRDELEDDANEYEGGNASFLIMEHGSGEPVPIGYAIAYMAESEMDNDESVVLYVRDVALREDKQKKGYGRQALQRLVQFASGRQGMPIEFYARESTSYAALKNSTDDLEKMGYRIVAQELDENHVGSGENFYLLRLEKIEKKKLAA